MGPWVESGSDLGLKRVDSDQDPDPNPKVMDLDSTQFHRV